MLTTVCKMCHGRGVVESNGWGVKISCSYCRGIGGFEVPDEKQLCTTCNGKGTVTNTLSHREVTCPTCKGEFFIDKK